MKFKIEITETLQRIVEIEAESLDKAIMQVNKDCAKGNIILDWADFLHREVTVYDDIPQGKHRCKYCGEITEGEDEDLLCEECRYDFGHAFYSEL